VERGKWKSEQELTLVLGGMVLPKIDTIDLKFLKMIVSGEKAHMTVDNCTKITIERFEEFNTTAALSQCQQDALCWKFVPDNWAREKAKVDRQFLWWVLATNRANFVAQL
jgi:hypothetical protein